MKRLFSMIVVVSALLVAGCGDGSAGPADTPQDVLRAAYQAIDDGRYSDVCSLMYEPEPDCATSVASSLAIGDYDGLGKVQVDESQIEFDDSGNEATIPVSALTWPGGKSYPFLSDERLEYRDGRWWLV